MFMVAPIWPIILGTYERYILQAVGLGLVCLFAKWLKRKISGGLYNQELSLIYLPGIPPSTSWIERGNDTIRLGLSLTAPHQAFQVMSDQGPLMTLRNRYATEIASNEDMSLSAHLRGAFFPDYPGFEGVAVGLEGRIHDLVRDMIARNMSQSFDSMILEHLLDETKAAIHDVFGESVEWHATMVCHDAFRLVSRITGRVLVGKQLCRDHRWLKIAALYNSHTAYASKELRRVAHLLRPVVHWFLPSCKSLRSVVKDAVEVIGGEMQRRKTAAEKASLEGIGSGYIERSLQLKRGQASQRGDTLPRVADSIAWLTEQSRNHDQSLGLMDLVSVQLGMTVAAYGNTADALQCAIVHLCEHPDLFDPLRNEVIQIIGKNGWAKSSLHHLQVMDSFLKESQRHSRGLAFMVRVARRDVVLSDGLVVSNGTRVQLISNSFEENVHSNPTTFDAYRFLKKKEGAIDPHKWQYASTSSEHVGFGLGLHACPGRFFVTNELKIILSHLLLKYDWSIDPAYGNITRTEISTHPVLDIAGKLRVKRRKEEIDLDAVAG